MRLLLLSLSLASLCMTACRPAWQDAFDRAQRSRTAGDDVDAAAQFRLACQQGAPEETGACKAAASTAARAAREAIERGEKQCRAGEVSACLSHLAGARGVTAANTKERATMEELLEVSSGLHMESCARLPLKSIDDAVARFRCVALLRKELALPAHNTRVEGQSQTIAGFLLDEAHRHEGKNAFGAAAVNAGLARCVSGGAEAKRLIDDDGARFLEGARLPAVVQIAALSPATTDRICQAVGAGPLRCSKEKGADKQADKAAVVARGALRLAALKHSSLSNAKLIEYVAGVEQIPNPEYNRLSRELETDRRAVRDRQAEAGVAKGACDAAEAALRRAENCTDCKQRTEQETECNRSAALAEVLRRDSDDFDNKKVLLSRTPRQIDRERLATHSWIETSHRWDLPWALVVDGAAPLEDTITVTDIEQPGFAPAGIPADGRADVTTLSLMPTVEERAAAHVQAELVRQQIARGKSLAPSCHAVVDDGARIDCQLKALWYSGSDPVTTWLEDLAARADAPWPRAACVE